MTESTQKQINKFGVGLLNEDDGNKHEGVFVVSKGENVVTITTDFKAAYKHWKRLAKGTRFECQLEAAGYGTVCCVEPSEDEDGSPLVKLDSSGGYLNSRPKHEPIPSDFAVQPLKRGEDPPGKTTCGHCGLSWDDDKPTQWTPVPSGRCPFEYFHLYPDE
jgi:hypothetical protein